MNTIHTRFVEIEDARQKHPLEMREIGGEWLIVSEMEARQVEIDRARCQVNDARDNK